MATFMRIGSAAQIAVDLSKGTTASDGLSGTARNCGLQRLSQAPVIAFGWLYTFTITEVSGQLTIVLTPMQVSQPLPPPWAPVVIG